MLDLETKKKFMNVTLKAYLRRFPLSGWFSSNWLLFFVCMKAKLKMRQGKTVFFFSCHVKSHDRANFVLQAEMSSFCCSHQR
jgi:hypothetical protein